jgi:hypothetical protein
VGLQETETDAMVGGEGDTLLPPPPPPQDTYTAKVSATRIKTTNRRARDVPTSTAFVSSDIVGYLAGGFVLTDPD